MIRITLLFIFFNLFYLMVTMGQGFDLSPSSPEASSLGKYIDFPINLHTGTHKIGVPIYELETASIKVPVSLTYHSAGVKLQEIASRSGMGWTLRAGGAIICAPGGAPDLGYSIQVNDNTDPFSYTADTHDIFYYSFDGYEGKFVVDVAIENGSTAPKVKQIHKIDSNNLVIKSVGDGFSIRDDKGAEYIFSKTENTSDKVEYMAPPLDDNIPPYWTWYKIDYTSSWSLTEIKLNNGESVVFNYNNSVQISYDKETTSTYVPQDLYPLGTGVNWGTVRYRTISTKLLTGIKYRDKDISFHYDRDRLDLQGDKALTDIKIFSRDNVRHIRLDQSFKDSYNCTSSVSAYACKRMFLSSIRDMSDAGSPIMLYRFFYNDTALPHRKSFNMDYWGYYNQIGSNVARQLAVFIYPNSSRHYERYLPFKKPLFNSPEIILPGRNGDVNETLAQAGVLNRIEYPTGGITEFEYESNEFLWFPENTNNIAEAYNLKGGGLRIKRILQKDGTGNSIIKTFNYQLPGYTGKTSGGVVSIPLYAYPGLANKEGNVTNTTASYQTVMVKSFYDQNVLGAESSTAIGYRYVTVETAGVGKTLYQYSFPGAYGDIHDDLARGCRLDFEGICDNMFQPHVVAFSQYNDQYFNKNLLGKDLISTQINTFPFGPHTNYGWNRGLLLKETNYDQAGKEVLQKEYTYRLVYANKKKDEIISLPLPALKRYVGPDPASFKSTSHKLLLGIGKSALSEKETVYIGGGMSTTKRYTYDLQKLLVASEEILTSDGRTKKKEYKYPHHKVSNGAVYGEMVNKNMISYPVEELDYLNSTLIAKKVINYSYDWFSNKSIIAPIDVQIGKGSSIPVSEVNYLSYDNKGRPLSFKINNGSLRAYKFSDDILPIAEIENAAENEVFYESFEKTGNVFNSQEAHTGRGYFRGNYSVAFSPSNGKKYIIEYWYRVGSAWKYVQKGYTTSITLTEGEVDDIRVFPDGTLVKSYTYGPLAGMTGMIDVSGITKRYEYDRFGRLKIIKDGEGLVLQQFDYQYKNASVPGPGTPTYYSQLASKVYTRNNCPTGFQGSTVTYTIEAGRYTGSTQAEADGKAQTDLNTNGQDYANINGQCVDKCEGVDRKIINGVCETGRRVYTRSVQIEFDTWACYYRYEFSDGTRTQEYYDHSTSPCPR